MQTSFGRVAYYLFLIAGIFASVSLHMMALIGSYWLEGEVLGGTFNAGLWQFCIRVIKCTNVLDNAHLLAGNLSLVLTLLYCYSNNTLYCYSEAVARRCSLGKALLNIWQISQEKGCTRVSLNNF